MRTLGLGLLAILAATCALLSNGAPVSAAPTDKEKSEMAAKVYTLLKDKCASCHGADAKKVMGKKGTLNYILDYDKLISEKLIDTASPEKSPLYEEISEGNMPRELDKDGKPTTKKKLAQAEIDLVLNWIKAGAPKWVAAQSGDLVPKELRVSEGTMATAKFAFELPDATELFKKLNGKLPLNAEFNFDKMTDKQTCFVIDDSGAAGVLSTDGRVDMKADVAKVAKALGSDASEESDSYAIGVIAASSKAKSNALLKVLQPLMSADIWRIRLLVKVGTGVRAVLPLARPDITEVEWGEDRGPDKVVLNSGGYPQSRVDRRSPSMPDPGMPGQKETPEQKKKKEVEAEWALLRFREIELKNAKGASAFAASLKHSKLTEGEKLYFPSEWKPKSFLDEMDAEDAVGGIGRAPAR